MAVKVTCIDKIINTKTNIITRYIIKDEFNNTKEIDSSELKEAIRNGVFECDNLTLTSNNRLITKNRKSINLNDFKPNIFGIEVRNIDLVTSTNTPELDNVYYTGEVWLNNQKLGNWQQGEEEKASKVDFNINILQESFNKYIEYITKDYKSNINKCEDIKCKFTIDKLILKVIVLTEYFNIYKQVTKDGYKGIIVITDEYDYLVKIIRVSNTITKQVEKLISKGSSEIRARGYRENPYKPCTPVIKYYLSLEDFSKFI